MIVTKTQVVREFKDIYFNSLREFGRDKTAKNELFWQYVDSLMKDGYVTRGQWRRWANPF